MATLASRITDLATRIATECKSLRTLLNGNAADLSALTTTAKTNLVAAVNEIDADLGTLSTAVSNLSNGASADSPAFTGIPTAPTAVVNTNTTQLATTAFVLAQAGSATPAVNGTAAVGVATKFAREDHVHGTDSTRAPLASPTFTGVPAAPTASAGTNTTQLATTAFAMTAAANAVAAMINSAPAALDTLTELAAALGNDANFATTINTALGYRLRYDAAQTLTAGQITQACANLGLGEPNTDFTAVFTAGLV